MKNNSVDKSVQRPRTHQPQGNRIDLVNENGIARSSQASYYAPGKHPGSADASSLTYMRAHTRVCKDSIYIERPEFTLDLWKYIDNPIYARLKNLY